MFVIYVFQNNDYFFWLPLKFFGLFEQLDLIIFILFSRWPNIKEASAEDIPRQKCTEE